MQTSVTIIIIITSVTIIIIITILRKKTFQISFDILSY